jgi:predicted  nucleic acid-binding Zn-ribbon protein
MFHLHSRDVQGHAKATSSVISGFDHQWRVYLPNEGIVYEEGDAPPPFEAYGKNCHFVLEHCLLKGCKQCYSYTIRMAEKEIENNEAIFLNYSTLFGIKRNKALSIQVKKNKAQEMELESESSSEEEVEEEEEAGVEEEAEAQYEEDGIFDSLSAAEEDEDALEEEEEEESEDE